MNKLRIQRIIRNKLRLFLGEKLMRKLYNYNQKLKVKILRKKEIINVLFILNDVSKWKSEELYKLMQKHPRFNAVLGVTVRELEAPSASSRKVFELIAYLQKNNYSFVELVDTYYPQPDLVIYTEPYGSAVPIRQSVFSYWNALIVSINYSCHTTHLPIDYHTRVHECAWIDCYESKSAILDAHRYIGYKRKNIKLTGLPMFDALQAPSSSNPWKRQNKLKKKIIWAPHHSLGGFEYESIVYGNFIEMHEYMFKLAEQYQDKIQIAFKPHPLLREKLEAIWGLARTDEYYTRWKLLNNGQLETGEYTDLFKNSDALIHDSSSFIVEYQIINKPSLFMVRNERKIIEDLNVFGKRAFYSQELGYNYNDVKKFIEKIINGEDPNRDKRINFLNSEIEGLNGDNASHKIIDEILNELKR